MLNAVDAVNKGENLGLVAKRFRVPRVTLRNKVTGKSPLICSMGPETYLTKDEENILEKWIVDMYCRRAPITKHELLDRVQRMITEKQKETPFHDNRPGKKWYNLFLKRHPVNSFIISACKKNKSGNQQE